MLGYFSFEQSAILIHSAVRDLADRVRDGAVAGFRDGHNLVLPLQIVGTPHQEAGLFLQAFDGDMLDVRFVRVLDEIWTFRKAFSCSAVSIEELFLFSFLLSESPAGGDCLRQGFFDGISPDRRCRA